MRRLCIDDRRALPPLTLRRFAGVLVCLLVAALALALYGAPQAPGGVADGNQPPAGNRPAAPAAATEPAAWAGVRDRLAALMHRAPRADAALTALAGAARTYLAAFPKGAHAPAARRALMGALMAGEQYAALLRQVERWEDAGALSGGLAGGLQEEAHRQRIEALIALGAFADAHGHATRMLAAPHLGPRARAVVLSQLARIAAHRQRAPEVAERLAALQALDADAALTAARAVVRIRTSRPGRAAPDFRLARLGEGVIHLQALRGRTVLLVFWSTRSPSAVRLIEQTVLPWRTRYAADRLAIVAIGVKLAGESPESLTQWFAGHPAWRLTPGFDAGGRIARAYGVGRPPWLVLIDATGRVVTAGTDRSALKRMRGHLEAHALALPGNAGAAPPGGD